MQYASGTIQMRLLAEHSSAEDAKAATGLLTLFDRLFDIAVLSGASAFSNDEARTSYRKSVSQVRGRLVSLLTGTDMPEPEPEKKPVTDEQMIRYAAEVGGEFQSFESLIGAVEDLNARIASRT